MGNASNAPLRSRLRLGLPSRPLLCRAPKNVPVLHRVSATAYHELSQSAMPYRSWRRLVSSWTGNSLLALLAVCSVQAAPRIKVIKLAVTNLSPLPRPSENVVVPVSTLQAIARDFAAATVIVTTSLSPLPRPSENVVVPVS